MTEGLVSFDHGPLNGATAFSDPVDVIRADSPEQVHQAFERLNAATKAGKWLAGYFSYELGYCLEPRLTHLIPDGRKTPLILMGVYDGCYPAAPIPNPHDDMPLSGLTPALGQADYLEKFQAVHDYLCAGDAYQVNLTFPLTLRSTATAPALYAALQQAQPVAYGAYVDLGGPILLSRSPELFFQVNTDRLIETRPMKGTAARGKSEAEDVEAREWLARSEKNQAENLMIVDLLRNDLSRISQVGSVKVPDLFQIETYTTVHQMVSKVQAQLLPNVGLVDILKAIFPCGSITGAPKLRAMEIIRELEDTPRDAYCGAIGWVAPSGQMRFNVAIRTLLMQANGDLQVNAGGGIVYDSTGTEEFQEALWKTRYLKTTPQI
ncbi:aminodeoxychorismate synthase component I [Actibacterium lipolyticum]|uniref:Aminodeoxychorismate synthase component 1 n=1 Tax=Actibacterium lipolyticum TaxID=1524263 RepID=A0A238L7G0_9RHOB|nr:aminodeoxychorismate synthase component I [Actibacterium lipolyticum]SMX51043.1 Aminodeoxychorismate synthase component 1 [Actibacterium lipolyticum]